jgi:hypothetical protein
VIRVAAIVGAVRAYGGFPWLAPDPERALGELGVSSSIHEAGDPRLIPRSLQADRAEQ